MKLNWKVLTGLIGKKMFPKEFTVNGVSANDTAKVYNSSCSYFIENPISIHESNPLSSFSNLDQIVCNVRPMCVDMLRTPKL